MDRFRKRKVKKTNDVTYLEGKTEPFRHVRNESLRTQCKRFYGRTARGRVNLLQFVNNRSR